MEDEEEAFELHRNVAVGTMDRCDSRGVFEDDNTADRDAARRRRSAPAGRDGADMLMRDRIGRRSGSDNGGGEARTGRGACRLVKTPTDAQWTRWNKPNISSRAAPS